MNELVIIVSFPDSISDFAFLAPIRTSKMADFDPSDAPATPQLSAAFQRMYMEDIPQGRPAIAQPTPSAPPESLDPECPGPLMSSVPVDVKRAALDGLKEEIDEKYDNKRMRTDDPRQIDNGPAKARKSTHRGIHGSTPVIQLASKFHKETMYSISEDPGVAFAWGEMIILGNHGLFLEDVTEEIVNQIPSYIDRRMGGGILLGNIVCGYRRLLKGFLQLFDRNCEIERELYHEAVAGVLKRFMENTRHALIHTTGQCKTLISMLD